MNTALQLRLPARVELFDLLIVQPDSHCLNVDDIETYSHMASEHIDLSEPVDTMDAQEVYTALQACAMQPHKLNSIRDCLFF